MESYGAVDGVRPERVRVRQVQVEGEPPLVEQLEESLRAVLGGRGTFYHVQLDSVGRCGEVMVRITGSRGRLPLLFERGELTPGYVRSIVRSAVEKYAF